MFVLKTSSIYASIKVLVSINSDKLVIPESKFSWIFVYKISKNVFVSNVDAFVSLTNVCNEYANTKICAFAS